MAEYKSRRERRLAQVSKAGGSKSPAAIALIVDVSKKPKKKDGGSVEGEKARHHLGKRARGGATDEPRKTKQLDAREAALYSNGVDKVAEGSHREEREVPEEEREGGDDATNKVDDFYLKTWDGSINPKQMFLARPSKFGADADHRRARGGRAEGGATSKGWTAAARDAWAKEHDDFARQKSKEMYEDEASPGNNEDRARGGRAQKRADGGSVAKSKFEVDDDSAQNKGDLGPSRGKAPQYENDEDKDKRASGGWIGPAREKMERKGTVGSLHKALHVSEGSKISSKRLEEARKDAGPALRKKIQFAENVRK